VSNDNKLTGNCPKPAERTAFICGQMSPDQAARLEQHAAECAVCRAAIAAGREVMARLRADADQPADRDLSATILARLPADAWGPARQGAWTWSGGWKLAAALAGLLLAGVLAMLWRPVARPAETSSDTQARAVRDALNWLARAQAPDGAWDPARWGAQRNYKVGLAALALAALLSAENPDTPATDDPAIGRAVAFLLGQQAADGRFGPYFSGAVYNHGLATWALLAAYDRAPSPALKDALDRALAYIQRTQSPAGGWSYTRAPADAANTAASLWPLLALLQAEEAGWTNCADAAARGVAWWQTRMDAAGRTGYREPGDFPYGAETLTAMGALCLTHASRRGNGPAEIVRQAEQAMSAAAALPSAGPIDFYRTYFTAMAMHAAGDESGRRQLTTHVRQRLLATQTRSGSERGSWAGGDRWSAAGGRIYTTALAVLALQSRPARR